MPSLLVGLFLLIAIGRALVIGSASADGNGIQRSDEPLFYWLIIALGSAASAFLIYTYWRG